MVEDSTKTRTESRAGAGETTDGVFTTGMKLLKKYPIGIMMIAALAAAVSVFGADVAVKTSVAITITHAVTIFAVLALAGFLMRDYLPDPQRPEPVLGTPGAVKDDQRLRAAFTRDGRLVDPTCVQRLVSAGLRPPPEPWHVESEVVGIGEVEAVNAAGAHALRAIARNFADAATLILKQHIVFYAPADAGDLECGIKGLLEYAQLDGGEGHPHPYWVWPLGNPDAYTTVRLSDRQVDDIPIAKIPDGEPDWLNKMGPRMIWSRIIPAVALSCVNRQAASDAEREVSGRLDLTGWLIARATDGERVRTRHPRDQNPVRHWRASQPS
ncbi:hypothetical protein [Kineosporia sp. R_H_3]|uniref:hypothetical protein n=1 Tax=Kineosporia sp. R_H_3 TaxID=1961848 RepID=UPI000B4AE0AD|nr:hypothetical protein [Kineosporia sp. R_H_3]